jgi:predicted ribosome quality control (RQC) complex YloA/Tae2 family protein
MPFDGILTHFMAQELNSLLQGGRIGKIHQMDRDAVVLQVRANSENYRLLITCNAAAPRIHLTSKQYENPDTPPVFCMLMRKHLSGALIKGFTTNGFERILFMEVEATDELGDRSNKKLAVEIMGRHSNIILLNKSDKIIDAIKHVDSEVNRVRELLPARTYILPPAQNKLDPAEKETSSCLMEAARQSGKKLESFLLDNLQGFSPILCRELCTRAGLDERTPASSLSDKELIRLTETLAEMMESLLHQGPSPVLILDPQTGRPVDFHITPMTQFPQVKSLETISEAVDSFYQSRQTKEVISQRTAELIKIMSRHLEKCEKRLSINVATLEENQSFEDLRVMGELITANIYALSKGMDSARLLNYYSQEEAYIDIPLIKDKNPQENAQLYFKRYNKAKNAHAYALSQIESLRKEQAYLESVLFAIENAEGNDQLLEIRQELFEQGYLNTSPTKGRKALDINAAPLKVLSGDGFEIAIGRNNKQNDKLTLKSARHEDIWFHIKNFPGSHVVIRTDGKTVPDATLLEAAQYAAWFSKARSAPKVEVDYTQIRNVKKPSGAKPGMVIYVNYATLVVTPREPSTTEEG